jgi:hypothetical protein
MTERAKRDFFQLVVEKETTKSRSWIADHTQTVAFRSDWVSEMRLALINRENFGLYSL